MNKGEINILIKAGYLLNFNNSYVFKVKKIRENKIYIHSAIFINIENKMVTFEGADNFREELLNEAKSLIGGLKC